VARRRRQSWEEKLIELSMGAGVATGLLTAAGAAHRRVGSSVCQSATKDPSRCVSHAFSDAIAPYLRGAAVGAVAGLLIGALLVVTWKYMRGAKSGPFARRTQPARPGRQAIPERIRYEVWRRDRGTCVDCGSRARLEFDHIVPLARGGSNTARNLEIRCERCNRGKGARI
jgi:hypothetical protein